MAELNPHLLFLIAGPGLGRYASRQLPDNLVYVGFHPREKLPVIYNAFDIYCFLSMSGEETFGLTVLEAMACGVPPIVPNFDGVPSVVADAGLIADAENFDQDIATLVSYPCPMDFSEKINLLVSDAEMCETLSEKARERAVSFTWDKTARRIIELFEELHRKKQMNLEELLASRIARMGKPTLELFVMSHCPYAVQAEEKLIPILKKFGDAIDFKLQFIAQEKEVPSTQDITPFISLRGYPEVAEDIRQLLIAQEYPDRYLDYILCRGKKLDKSWEVCAQKLGIDVAKIQALFDTSGAGSFNCTISHFIRLTASLGCEAKS